MRAISERRLATKSKKTLQSLMSRLIDLSCEWEDLDEYLRSELAGAADVLKALVSALDDIYPPRSKRP